MKDRIKRRFKKDKEKSRKPSNSAFKQQRLKACQPILTPIPVITSFFVIGVIFVPLGALMLVTSNQIAEEEVRYDKKCEDYLGGMCTITITLDEDMKKPVYFYYKLSNFYQNHRRYVKSRSDAQLRGDTVDSYADLTDCEPEISKDDEHDEDSLFLPCGLIAKSWFNDTFELINSDGEYIEMRKEGIAWDSDVNNKFHNPGEDAPGIRVIPDFQDEDFIVWMRVAGLPVFRKLYRIIEEDLPKGKYTVRVANYFPVSEFDGKKFIVLSESSWMGGKNPFLGIAYIVVGSLCICLATLFACRHFIKPRRLGDESYLK
eukprot:CAMPEP_0174251914 /NCGR_PEP_ID=MMETSP0439-20130205/1589_1 /TAXON_ID=0 /ORGANISM="Stereomyxa ramosa, Strain Chinc5" /LENGTH=315 /DNA_ID=CAMNT_0015332355 /DNA_START=25 /DNA_END=969 /DNA_ORIENTATION=+